MIIRQLSLRHGRIALARPANPSWRRALASAVEEHTRHFDHVLEPSAIGLSQQDAEPAIREEQLQTIQDPKLAKYARDHWELQAFKKKTRPLGGALGDHYRPHLLINHPPWPQDITLELLMASQAHLGHATGLWHPGNARYIFGIRDGIHIISLDVTASHLRRACKIVEATALEGGLILFVGTRSGQEQSVVKAAELAGGCHLFDRWIPGSITNRIQILGNCRTKVVDQFDKDIPGFEKQLGGQGPVKPDLVICLNPLENHVLLRECNQHNIPTIGVVDTDCNPALVTYPIPANDDSRRCTNVIAGVLGRAAQSGRTERLTYADEFGSATYDRRHKLMEISANEDEESLEMDSEALEEDIESVEEKEFDEEDELDKAKENKLKGEESKEVNPSSDPRAEHASTVEAEKVQAAFEMFEFSGCEDDGADLLLADEQVDEPLQDADVKTAEDPVLARLIALKRRALGEELSSKDREVLQVVEQTEAAIRAEVEKGRKELAEEAEEARSEFKRAMAAHARESSEVKGKELQAKFRQRDRSRREENVSYGPVMKSRRGRPEER